MKPGNMYFLKDLEKKLGHNDSMLLYRQDGSIAYNLRVYLNKDDELYLKAIEDTEWIDPYTGAGGKCKIYKVEVPEEVYQKAIKLRTEKNNRRWVA